MASQKQCAHPGCERTKPTHQWANKTKAGKGWFDQQNGDSWCPDHIPEWYHEWKAKRGG